MIKLEILGLELLCQASKLNAYCTIKCSPFYRALSEHLLTQTPFAVLLLVLLVCSLGTLFLPAKGSACYHQLLPSLAWLQVPGCRDASADHLHFPPILSLHSFWLPNFRCCNVRISQACIYVEQEYLLNYSRLTWKFP